MSLLRRWQDRAGAVRRERLELLTRYDMLAAGTGSRAARRTSRLQWPNRTDRVRMVAGLILAALVLFAVVVIVLARLA